MPRIAYELKAVRPLDDAIHISRALVTDLMAIGQGERDFAVHCDACSYC